MTPLNKLIVTPSPLASDKLAFTPLEAASLLRINRLTVYDRIRRGNIRAARNTSGQRTFYLIPRSELERLLGLAE